MKRKMLWISEEDQEAIGVIARRYGLESDSSVMRLALRVLAAAPMLRIALPERRRRSSAAPKPEEKRR